MQHPPDPTPPETTEPGRTDNEPHERSADAKRVRHVGEHRFEYPTVAPASRLAPPATRKR